MGKYEIGLANKDCLFDQADGFDTPQDAMRWALGRGGCFVAQICDPEFDNFCSFSVDSKDRISVFTGSCWKYISVDQLSDYV